MSLQESLRSLRESTRAEAAAVINRDGAVVAAELPPGVSQETFSIMCAAIMGAGTTAATELKHVAPNRVILESEDVSIFIQGIGRRSMLVLVMPPGGGGFDDAIARFLQAVAQNLDGGSAKD